MGFEHEKNPLRRRNCKENAASSHLNGKFRKKKENLQDSNWALKPSVGSPGQWEDNEPQSTVHPVLSHCAYADKAATTGSRKTVPAVTPDLVLASTATRKSRRSEKARESSYSWTKGCSNNPSQYGRSFASLFRHLSMKSFAVGDK